MYRTVVAPLRFPGLNPSFWPPIWGVPPLEWYVIMKVENSRPRCNYCCGCNFNEAWRKFNLHFWLKNKSVEQFFNNFRAKKNLTTLPRNLHSFKSALFTEHISRSHLNDKTAIKRFPSCFLLKYLTFSWAERQMLVCQKPVPKCNQVSFIVFRGSTRCIQKYRLARLHQLNGTINLSFMTRPRKWTIILSGFPRWRFPAIWADHQSCNCYGFKLIGMSGICT